VGSLPVLAEPQDPVLGLTEIVSSAANSCQGGVREGLRGLVVNEKNSDLLGWGGPRHPIAALGIWLLHSQTEN